MTMAQGGGYKEELSSELKLIDPSSHASRLVAQEIDRLVKGDDNVDKKKEKPAVSFMEIHTDRPQKITVKVRIPVKEHPKYNFVGKLLGPKGQTLKDMQEQTGCKMAIMGKGSMRDKNKEEDLRKEGGKFAHLNEDLHVLVECYADPIDGYFRIANALLEVKKFLIPVEMGPEGYEGEMGMGGDMGMNGQGGHAPRGRGGFMGGPPDRGARAGFRGNGHPAQAGRGAAPVRGGAPSGRGGGPRRGGPRGAPSSHGAPPSRGARTAAPSYDGYSAQGYGSAGYDQSYDDGSYSSSHATADSSYYDYGAGSQSGYEGYAGYGDYGDQYPAKPTQSPRGAARPAARAHPYNRPTQGGY